MGSFTLTTGQKGSGRFYWINRGAEHYMSENNQPVYSFPVPGFEQGEVRSIELSKIGRSRPTAVYEVIIENSFDKTEQVRKHIPKLKQCRLIIPCAPAYVELIPLVLDLRASNDLDVVLIRDTIKDLPKITHDVPDLYRVHADYDIPLNKVYFAELKDQLGAANALAYMLAQWFVNAQQEVNKKQADNIFAVGYFLDVTGGKILTNMMDKTKQAELREDIITTCSEMLKTRFEISVPDIEMRDMILEYLD